MRGRPASRRARGSTPTADSVSRRSRFRGSASQPAPVLLWGCGRGLTAGRGVAPGQRSVCTSGRAGEGQWPRRFIFALSRF